MQWTELVCYGGLLFITACWVLDFIFYGAKRRAVYRRFLKHQENDADRSYYQERLNLIKDKCSPAMMKVFVQARNKLNNHEQLEKSDLYWLRYGVHPIERFLRYWGELFTLWLVICLVRAFFYEPFIIPSGSMEPTLQNGDGILVNKYTYGPRIPLINKELWQGRAIERGDVIVFRYPLNPKNVYIKRVVATPDDTVKIAAGRVWINGEEQTIKPSKEVRKGYDDKLDYQVFSEQLGMKKHALQFLQNEAQRNQMTMEFVVPKDKYFVMGDNRDNSEDSRFWGFVPRENIIGEARYIGFNTDCLTLKGYCARIGTAIQ